MHYERIIIELDDIERGHGGWIRFTRPHGYGGAHSQDCLEIAPGFTLEHVLAAVDATPWVVERNGERRIQDDVGCDSLVRVVKEMFSYFDRPDVPNDELRGIKRHIDSYIEDAGHGDAGISLWALAWLDLVVREDLADAARSANTLWDEDHLTIDVGTLRDERIRELLDSEPQTTPDAQGMADSTRIRGRVSDRTRSAG